MAETMEASAARRSSWWRVALSLALGIAFGWLLLAGGLPIVPEPRALAHVGAWTVVVYALSLVGVHLLRALRWRHLLAPLGKVSVRQVLASSFIGFAAIMLLPLRAGEVVRPLWIARKSSVRAWEATGSVAAERIIDGLALSAILFVALALGTPIAPEGDLGVAAQAVPAAAYAALALFACAFVAMLVFHFRRASGVAVTRASLGWISKRLAERVAQIVERVASGMRFLPQWRHLAPFLLETIGYWALNAVGLMLLAQGIGLSAIGIAEACVVMGCLGIGILVPSGPGFFGTFQLSIYLALAVYVDAATVTLQGSAFVFVAYCAQLGQHILGAGVGLLLDAGATPAAEKLPGRQPVA